VVLAAVAFVAAAVLPGCSYLGGGKAGYTVVAYFPEAVALYAHSKVKVMGADAGTVQSVKIDGNRGIEVKMKIDRDVPLPTDVQVTIQALTIIGERNVVLSPAWTPGQPEIADHLTDGRFVIPAKHTSVPVEPDDGLKAFSDLAAAIDPNAVTRLVKSGADAFDGHGQTFNDLLGSASSLSTQLAAQDQQILQTARNLHTLASAVNGRSEQLGHVIDGFSQATGTLADQRTAVSNLLTGANQLIGAGQSLLDTYKNQLPGDLANLAQLGLTLQHNSDTFQALIGSFPKVAQSLINAYDPVGKQLLLGVDLVQAAGGILGPTAQIILGTPAAQALVQNTGLESILCQSPVLSTVLGCTS
jgi:virulence factor Mce-like protein